MKVAEGRTTNGRSRRKAPPQPRRPPKELTERQKAFCREFLVDYNGTAAAKRAGYAARGAHVEASRLLRNAKVAARLAELRAERSARTGITADQVLEELAVVAFSDVTHYEVGDDGRVVLTGEAAQSATRALSSVKRKTKQFMQKGELVTEHDFEIRLWNKPRALEMMGRHLGLFKEDAPAPPQRAGSLWDHINSVSKNGNAN